MKHRLLLFFFAYGPLWLSSQNLVLNPSFEDINCCPGDWSATYCSPYWTTNMNSWDLFHTCTNSVVSIPDNFAGHQWPATGESYGGFIAWGPDPDQPPPYFPIEVMGGTLAQPLQIGVEYFVSFKVSLAANNDLQCCICNKLGMLFVSQDYGDVSYPAVGRPPVVQDFAHVYEEEMMTDSVGWVTTEGSFIANEAYTHFLIGRFFTDPILTQNCWGPNIDHPNRQAYYYVDDVYVSSQPAVPYGVEDHVAGLVTITNALETGRIDITATSGTQLAVTLLDAMGRMVVNERSTSSTLSIRTDALAPGFYLVCPNVNERPCPGRPVMVVR